MEISSIGYEALAQRESPDAVIVVTGAGRVLHWNLGAQLIFGYSSDEAIGRNIAGLIVPANRAEEEARILAETLANGFATFESVRHRKNGTLVYVDISNKIVTDPAHTEPLILVTKKDVTHLRVQRETKQVEERFRAVLESTPDGIVMANPTGHIVFANSQAERLFAYEPGELRGKLVEALLPQRLHKAHIGHRSSYFAQPRVRAMGAGLELHGRRKNGSEFPVEISLSPLRMDETALVMSAIRDISDRKRIEQELREKNIALENASRAKDRFLASMSHELRTPLNAIIGFTGTLLMRLPGPLTEDQEKQLQTVQSSARHLLSLINDLLDVAKIEADRQELRREAVDCRAIVEEVAGSLRTLAERNGLDLTIAIPPESLMANTDRRAVSQILINLAGNAIKFTERGAVKLHACRFAADGHRGIAISVEDTGPGIREQDQAKLFESFTRLDVDYSRTLPGTGLGLHLSRKLAELLGGRLTFRSEYGKGSVFTLQLAED